MTESEMFEYAMLAWVALMIGTLLTVALHLAQWDTYAKRRDAKQARSRKGWWPDPAKQDAPNSHPLGSQGE